MLKIMGKKIFTIFAENFCLSKPVVFYSSQIYRLYLSFDETWCVLLYKQDLVQISQWKYSQHIYLFGVLSSDWLMASVNVQ